MKNKKFLLAIILLITFVTHASYIFNGFLWLDHNDLEQKRAILPMSEISSVFFRPFGDTSFYRPLVTILNSIDYFLYKDWAPGFHLTNIILHLAVVALTRLFLSRMIKIDYHYLLLAALIVGVHPASIMVVGWIIQRQELLLLIFTMLTIIFYIKAQQNTAIKYKLLTLISFAAALFSKETALVVIPLLLYIRPRLAKLQGVALKFGLVLTAFSYLILRFIAVPNLWGTQFTPLSIDQAIGTRLALLTKWVLILINPFKPNFSDSVPVLGLLSWEAIISFFIICVSLFIVIKYKFSSDITKSIILLFILIAPGLYLIPVPRVGSPHYAYLPSLAIAALIVTAVAAFNKVNNNLNRIAIVIVSIWILIASITTFTSGFQFKNDLTLFTKEVARDPDFVEGYYYLGNYYLKERNLEQAAKNYEQGLLDRPNILTFNSKNWIIINLAGVKLQQNKLTEAENLYSEALAYAEESFKPFLIFNKALVYFKLENYRKVIELLRDLTWDRPEAYLLLAKSYHAQGQLEDEIETLQKALPHLAEPEKSEVEAVINNFEL